MFECIKDCKACALHELNDTTGLPFRFLSSGEHRRVLLLLGDAPSYSDLKDIRVWSGYNGELYTKFIQAMGLDAYADICYGTCVRCKPDKAAPPTTKQYKTCLPNLHNDLIKLLDKYEEVILLACGSGVSKVLAGNSKGGLGKLINRQGQKGSLYKGLADLDTPLFNQDESLADRITVFATYNPSMLKPGRKPALIHAVQDHFTLVHRYLSGEYIPVDLSIKPEQRIPDMDTFPSVVSLDIETYGMLKGKNQTVFHPMKSIKVDKIQPKDLILTVSFAWFDTDIKLGTHPPSVTPNTSVYEWSNALHRKQIIEWFKRILNNKTTVIGQNISFDLQYLMMASPVLSYMLNPLELRIDDTMLVSFLMYDQRPERGLKALTKLLGIFNYDDLRVQAAQGRVLSSSDADLQLYNCVDTATTLIVYYELFAMIRERYGSNTPKLNQVCHDARNQVLWCVIKMENAGVAFDVPALEKVHEEAEALKKEAIEYCTSRGFTIQGNGSQKSVLNMFIDMVEELGLQDSPELELTTKKQEISIGRNNTNLLLGAYNKNTEQYKLLKQYASYVKNNKLTSSYTNKLLNDRRKGIVFKKGYKGRAFAKWYPNPRTESKDSISVGGTVQARYACKDPALQTVPPIIKHTITSIFAGGTIVGYDYSQVELRMAGLISGDDMIINAYKNGTDLHTQTALHIVPGAVEGGENWNQHRQFGKTNNFLALYKGGAKQLQTVAREQLGLDLELNECIEALNNFDLVYSTLRRWQDDLMVEVTRKGYVSLPTGWGRTFAKGNAAMDHINEICNCPVQTLAAQLTQSAQFAVITELMRRRLRSVVPLQIHDAIYVDVYPGEEVAVDEIMEEILPCPPLLPYLFEHYNREIPFEYNKESI